MKKIAVTGIVVLVLIISVCANFAQTEKIGFLADKPESEMTSASSNNDTGFKTTPVSEVEIQGVNQIKMVSPEEEPVQDFGVVEATLQPEPQPDVLEIIQDNVRLVADPE